MSPGVWMWVHQKYAISQIKIKSDTIEQAECAYLTVHNNDVLNWPTNVLFMTYNSQTKNNYKNIINIQSYEHAL